MTTQNTLSASAAGSIAIGDLTVNRLGFGAMRITGDGSGDRRGPAEALARAAARRGAGHQPRSTPPTPTGRTSARS